MPEISITTVLSDDDRDAIIQGVIEGMKRLISSQPDLLDPDAMSKKAGISPATLDRLRRAGHVPSLKIGNRRLYRPDAVIAALEERETKGGDHV